jgi:hypothetical protein
MLAEAMRHHSGDTWVIPQTFCWMSSKVMGWIKSINGADVCCTSPSPRTGRHSWCVTHRCWNIVPLAANPLWSGSRGHLCYKMMPGSHTPAHVRDSHDTTAMRLFALQKFRISTQSPWNVTFICAHPLSRRGWAEPHGPMSQGAPHKGVNPGPRSGYLWQGSVIHLQPTWPRLWRDVKYSKDLTILPACPQFPLQNLRQGQPRSSKKQGCHHSSTPPS